MASTCQMGMMQMACQSGDGQQIHVNCTNNWSGGRRKAHETERKAKAARVPRPCGTSACFTRDAPGMEQKACTQERTASNGTCTAETAKRHVQLAITEHAGCHSGKGSCT